MADQGLPPVDTDTLKPLGAVTQTAQAQTPTQGLPPVDADMLKPIGGTPASSAPTAVNTTDVSGKAGLDLATAGAAAQGAGEGLWGVAKGIAQLPYQGLVHGTSKEDESRLAAEGDEHKHQVYGKFKEDFRKGEYANAFKGLTDLFTSDKGTDPNDPIHQMVEQQWQSSQDAKGRAMEAAKKGDFAGVLQHSVGVVPIASQVDAAMTAFQKNPSRANLKEVVAAAIPAFIPSLMKGAAKVGGAAVDATKGVVREAVAPTKTVTPGGAEIPVRPETALGKAAFTAAPEEAAKLAQTKTSPAIERAMGKTIGEASGSTADTTLTPDDRMGLRGHSADLIGQAKAGYQHIDELSGNKLSEAQEAMDNSRRDFSTEGREAFKKASNDKQALLDQYRESAAAKGIDVDAADAAYRRGIAVKKMAAKLDTATGASTVEGTEHALNGTRLSKVIDDGIKNGSWKQMGLKDEHIAELQKLGSIAKEQTTVPTGKLMSGLGRAAIIAGGLSHGGILTALEAVGGVSAGEYLGGKVASHVVQDAIMSQDATKALADSMKTGDPQGVIDILKKDPSWVDKIKTYVQDQTQRMKNFGLGGEEGAAGNIRKRNVGEPIEKPSLIGKRGVKAEPEGTEPNWAYRVQPTGTETVEPGSSAQFTSDPKWAQDMADHKPIYPGQDHEVMKVDLNKLKPEDYTSTKEQTPTTPGGEPATWTRVHRPIARGEMEVHSVHPFEEGLTEIPPVTTANTKVEGASVLPTEKVGGSRISQRKPTGMKSTEDALNGDLTIGMDAIRKADAAKPGFAAKLADTVSKYPGFQVTPEEAAADPMGTLDKFVNHTADNLEWLHNQIPENIRGISKLWYDSAHELTKNWAKEYGVTHEQMAGATAALSPQNEWNNNVEVAKRVADILKNKQSFAWSPEMETTTARIGAKSENLSKIFSDIRGKSLADLDDTYDKAAWIRVYDEAHNARTMPNYAPDGSIRGVARNPVSNTPTKSHWNSTDGIAKAVSILEDGSKDNIHTQLGDMHKIRNFYNNIIDPWSKSGDVTIDTHAVGAGHLRPMGGSTEEVLHNFGGAANDANHGVNGTYGLYAEAYRQAAAKLGILPRELQSITWEGIRALYESRAKTPELKSAISQVWKDYKNGDITINDARASILKAAGGFKNPKWLSDLGQDAKVEAAVK